MQAIIVVYFVLKEWDKLALTEWYVFPHYKYREFRKDSLHNISATVPRSNH